MWEPTEPLSLPGNMSIQEEDGHLTLQIYWFRWEHALVLTLAITISGMFFSVGQKLNPRGQEAQPVYLMVAMMTGMGYWAMAGLLNRTRVHVTEHQLTVDIFPLPWWGYFERPAEEILQLYVDESYHYRKARWSFGNTGWGYNKIPHFNVRARLADGKDVAIIKRLRTAKEAKLVEQLVEYYMGIENTFVAGEMNQNVRG